MPLFKSYNLIPQKHQHHFKPITEGYSHNHKQIKLINATFQLAELKGGYNCGSIVKVLFMNGTTKIKQSSFSQKLFMSEQNLCQYQFATMIH